MSTLFYNYWFYGDYGSLWFYFSMHWLFGTFLLLFIGVWLHFAAGDLNFFLGGLIRFYLSIYPCLTSGVCNCSIIKKLLLRFHIFSIEKRHTTTQLQCQKSSAQVNTFKWPQKLAVKAKRVYIFWQKACGISTADDWEVSHPTVARI